MRAIPGGIFRIGRALFRFIWDTPGDASQKAQAFIELAVKKRAKLRYREWKKSKNIGKG